MDFIKYYACVVRVAALHAAHGVLLILIIAAGVVTYLNPQVEVLAIYTDGKWPLSLWRVSSRCACSLLFLDLERRASTTC
jgi:hypothetical protein